MRFGDFLLPAISGDALEVDELVVRFGFKQRYHYLWVAISRITHQVIGFRIGDRSFKSLWQFWLSKFIISPKSNNSKKLSKHTKVHTPARFAVPDVCLAEISMSLERVMNFVAHSPAKPLCL